MAILGLGVLCFSIFWLSNFKLAVLLVDFPLYVTRVFSLAACMFPLFYMLSVLMMICCGDFLFHSYLFGVLCASFICMGVTFLNLRKYFLWSCWRYDLCPLLGNFSLSIPIIQGFIFSWCHIFPVCSLPVLFFPFHIIFSYLDWILSFLHIYSVFWSAHSICKAFFWIFKLS